MQKVSDPRALNLKIPPNGLERHVYEKAYGPNYSADYDEKSYSLKSGIIHKKY